MNIKLMKNRNHVYSLLIFVLALAFFTVGSPSLFAQRKISIKLASLVPENTPWGAALNRMAADWARATNGEVEVIIYHNGTAGDEAETLRKLKLNQIQAAVFSSGGLSSVMPEVLALSYPFLIRDDAELDVVLSRIKPELDARIQRNGYVTLAWAKAGWVRFFSKTPVFAPGDLRRIKMAANVDNEEMVQAFKTMGYQIIAVHMGDNLMALNTGLIDSLFLSPIYVAGNQIFGVAKNMTGINVAPFMGGLLMNNAAWQRIPDKYKPQLQAICKRMEREIETSIANLEAEAISTMVRYGLIINEPNSQQRQEWYNDTAKYENSLIGGSKPVFNREYYQKINAILQEYRRGR